MAPSRRDDPQIALPLTPPPPEAGGPGRALVSLGGRTIDVLFVRHRRARHYIMRLTDAGGLCVTIPRGGSRAEAERFIRERHAWIDRQRYRRALDAAAHRGWKVGSSILFRGTPAELAIDSRADGRVVVRFADQAFTAPAAAATSLRPFVETFLRRLAARELPLRLQELAHANGLSYAAVSIRGQRTRWGSCSPSKRISLNWRLIQLPPAVADYVVLHELAHLKHMNHSARFWKDVERLCPDYRDARARLRANHGLRGTEI